jgi:hypothetical protein
MKVVIPPAFSSNQMYFFELSKQAGLEGSSSCSDSSLWTRRLHAPSAPPPVRRVRPSAPWRTGRVDSMFGSSADCREGAPFATTAIRELANSDQNL